MTAEQLETLREMASMYDEGNTERCVKRRSALRAAIAELTWQSPETRPKECQCILVKLKPQEHYEYYGKPVAAIYYGHKLKTTVEPIRLDWEDVVAWRPLD